MALESADPAASNVQGTGVLGLFPDLSQQGGVQVAGRLAWEQVSEWTAGAAEKVCYAPDGLDGGWPWRWTAGPVARARAVCAAVRAPRARLVLVWHVSLLRLLPFCRPRRARVALFLFGIEAWRPLGWLDRALLRRVDFFLTISDFTWQRFVHCNPAFAAAPHRTVHLGVGEPAGDAPAPPPSAPAALMLSRLDRREDYKGHRELIAAWPRVLERLAEAELWIAGEGDLRPALERQAAALGLQGRVRFFGYVSEAQKQDLLARARCLALPSRGEGFGLVYLEAMRLGRPCLVSTVDAGREVVNPPEAGLAADPEDPRALAEAVCRLLTPGAEWEAWSRQARARYEARFTARHFQERLLAALEGAWGAG